jgi:ATP/maltotriose-dependent transcriptional regulator MalT
VRASCADLDGALAWITLDAGDGDPVRLWRYVATAVDRALAALGRGALERLAVAGSPIEVAVEELTYRISAQHLELVVVLEDLDAVRGEESLSSLDYALRQPPGNMHVVVL